MKFYDDALKNVVDLEDVVFFKYWVKWDGMDYTFVVSTHNDAYYFLDECKKANEKVLIKKVSTLNYKEVLDDDDFEYSYAIEVIAAKLLPSIKNKKIYEIEESLKRLGIIA